MAFSFELKLAISSELYGAISAGPEQLLAVLFLHSLFSSLNYQTPGQANINSVVIFHHLT